VGEWPARRFAAGDLLGVLKEAGEPEGGHLLRFELPVEVALGEVEEGELDFGVGGEEGADLCELTRAPAVLEGVEVAPWGAGAGATAASAGRSGGVHGERIVGVVVGRSKGEVAEG
jgi:hypothetical protein